MPPASQTYVRPSQERPLGVAILAVLIGIYAAFLLIGGLLLLLFSGYVYSHAFALFGVSFFGAILLIILAIVLFVVASGLWNLEIWALALSIIVVLVSIVGVFLQSNFLELALLILLLVYLVLVRHHFS